MLTSLRIIMIQTRLFSKLLNTLISSRSCSSKSSLKKIGVIGSGPAGFYTARALLQSKICEVDIFEKLPAPCGLVRYGVAPDHPESKGLIPEFNSIVKHKRCKYYGNIHVGKDVSVAELLNVYDGVVLACGAEWEKKLNIPGEESKNVFSSNQFVSWYNSHPEFANLDVNLDHEVALVIGHGNVALDIARMLILDIDTLQKTDIAEHALEVLKKSLVKKVILAGRRGPIQSSFDIKELRELTSLTPVKVHPEDTIGVEELIPSLEKGKRRKNQFICDLAKNPKEGEFNKSAEIKYFRSPKVILSNSKGRVEKVIFSVNKLKDPKIAVSEVFDTGEEEVVDCGIVLKCIGYRSYQIDPLVPFDNEKFIIPNYKGRALNAEGLYCSGWIKSGPRGVILPTLHSSYETANTIREDFESGKLSRNPTMTREDLSNLLKSRGIKYVTYEGWMKIHQVEVEKGKAKGKSHEKICSIEEMLEIGGTS